MRAAPLFLLALALAGGAAAQGVVGEVKSAIDGSLAGARAGGAGKAGALCLGFEDFDSAKLEKEVDATAYAALLDEHVRAAAIPVATGRHEIAGRVSAVTVNICWPYVGFENWDKIKGTVTLSMAWKVDGVAVATSGSHSQPKSGPGGVKGLLQKAYVENLRQLLADPGLRTALATPEKIVEAPVLASAPAPTVVAPRPATPEPERPDTPSTPARVAATSGRLPVPLLQPGKVAQHAGKEPVTVYALEGGAGLSIKLSLKLVGEGGIVLHAPDGSQMLETLGAGNLELAAFLPRDELYYVSVLRAQSTKPFSLKFDVTEPDLHLAVFASGVGYSWQRTDEETNSPYEVRSCWLEPGLKLRRIYPKGVEEITLGRGGKEFGSWKLAAGTGGARERQVSFADGIATYKVADGTVPDVVRRIEELVAIDEKAKYHRYLCTAGDS